ncbi:hypothetical protein [Candidatus Nitrotoga sp. M5]|uniref:hypothetical protein n=1 Tax=Candidatus Nitrotoga sp. M5 TaxID=2890409 RepID=UPI001EF5B74C|nr:hypothetical protein [Candidatus Nitrotoga sp. M5]CAH1387026.1 hypothetical protein NTGM5_480022 [Candidatus Nitrotoga sp. M5]
MKYRVLEPILFHAGQVLFLDAKQVKPRRAVLKPLGGNGYAVLTEASFKAGEIIGLEDAVPKSMINSMRPVRAPKPDQDKA